MYLHARNVELCLDFILLLDTRQRRQSHANQQYIIKLQCSNMKMVAWKYRTVNLTIRINLVWHNLFVIFKMYETATTSLLLLS